MYIIDISECLSNFNAYVDDHKTTGVNIAHVMAASKFQKRLQADVDKFGLNLWQEWLDIREMFATANSEDMLMAAVERLIGFSDYPIVKGNKYSKVFQVKTIK